VIHTLGSIKFLFMAPFIVAFLFVVNLMTWSGEWWVKWAALGIGIAWIINLFKVMRAILLAGGLAAISALLLKNRRY
jgi:hypothetical protein